MREITYFHRNQADGFSMLKVSKTFINEVKKTEEIEEFFVPQPWSLPPIGTLKNIWFVFKHRNKHGVNHLTGDIHLCILALLGCKTVLTIHDMRSLAGIKNPIKKKIAYWLFYNFSLKFPRKIVCISETTKQEFQAMVKRKDKAEVIYNAIDPMFHFVPKLFNEQKPVILQIGTGWKKNHRNLFKSLSGITCKLRIIENPLNKLDDEDFSILKDMNIDFSIVSFLSDQEILEEYNDCDIVSFCSIAEGFGMPIVEANAVGRCVITSNIPPMTEIAADAACLVNPYDVNDMANGFKKIISNAAYRKELIENGQKNITRFQPQTIAKQYIQLYKEL
ncbi:mannosyltransferase [Bacteroidia bacterium]|nr:mannosyltransferase [Bacteroidia bacterium]